MSSFNILNYKDIDVNEIKFSNPEKVKGGSYISIPKYNGQLIYIQSPKLINKGLTKTEQRCSIELELDNTHLNFYEFITNIDDFNIVEIQKNSKEWFKQEFPLDVVEEFYKSPVKMARSKKAPSLKIKIPLSKGTIDCGIYNNNNQFVSHSEIKENSKVLTVLQFYGLRFLKQQVICEWVPMQIKIFDENVMPQNNYLIDDSLLSDNEDICDEVDEVDEVDDVNKVDDVDKVDDVNKVDNVDDVDKVDDVNKVDEIKEIIGNQTTELKEFNPEEILNNELNLNEIDILNNELNLNENQDIDILNNSQNKENYEIQKHFTTTGQTNAQVTETNEQEIPKVNVDSLQYIINEKNQRIELLENKIRELYKYLSKN